MSTEAVMHEPNVFDYFRRGRDGVKERFSERVRAAIKEHSLTWADIAQLERTLGLQRGVILDILYGNPEAVNYESMQSLMSALDFTIEEGFGEFEVPDTDVSFWNDVAARERFGQVAGIGSAAWPAADRLKLFVILRAFKRL